MAIILLLATAIASVSLADAKRERHALNNMAVGISTILTDEQRTAIHEKIMEMKEAGKTREEIKIAVAKMLTDYGIDVPKEWFSRERKSYYLCADLTDEQRAAIHEKITEMKEAGATIVEIRTAVAEMLTKYGIEVPEDWIDYRKHDRLGVRDRLNLRIGMDVIADLAMIDSEISTVSQANPKKILGTLGKIRASQ